MPEVKHVFVVNPAAGQASAEKEIAAMLAHHATPLPVEFYVTKFPGDATDFVRRRCQRADGPLRFYACGGDGTLNEVVNGAVGCAQAAVTSWPSGSGNDYVKYYGGAQAFLQLDNLLAGSETPVDLMLVNDERYAINMVHFGLDSAVAQTMARVKRLPVIGGKNAYLAGVAKAFVTAVNNSCRVSVQGQRLNEDAILLCTMACGQYVGGAFRSSPHSDNADGLMDVCVIKPISRWRIPALMGVYKRGEHLTASQLKHDIACRRGTQALAEAPQPFAVSLDGELLWGRRFEVRLIPQAIRFVVPAHAKAINKLE